MANLPNLAVALRAEAAVEAELANRLTKVSPPRVIRTSAALTSPTSLLSEGTAVTVVGRRGTAYLNDLAQALQSGEAESIRRACAAVLERSKAALQSMGELFRLASASTIVDVTYGRSWLARHVVVTPTADIAIDYAVWSGGAVDERHFAVREHPHTSLQATDVDVLVILVEPQLTEIEAGLVRAVPAELSDLHIHGPSVAWTTVLTIGGIEQMLNGGPDPERGMNRIGFPVQLLTHLIGMPFGEKRQQDTTVDQRQNQQEDTRQQQQQQQHQQADTAHQQQQQQQQQQAENTKQQQQQQQHEQDKQHAQQQEKQQQQQQEQQRQTEQQQREQQENQVNRADKQQDRYHHQAQQERQAQTQVEQRQQDQRHHQDVNTRQQNEWSRVLDDLMGEGLSVRPFDNIRYRTLLEAIDFESLDATQSVRTLLRLREELLKQGLG